MFAWRNLLKLGLVSLVLALPLSGCGEKEAVIKHANVKAGSMPAGESWQGVYYSPLYGNLHIVVEGNTAQGAWRTGAGDAYGEMQGEVDGDVLRYSWRERKIGQVGPMATRTGKGYFKYLTKEGEASQITGEWGLGENEAGDKWEATKQINREPDLKSVKPDEFENRVKAGDWDQGESGESPQE